MGTEQETRTDTDSGVDMPPELKTAIIDYMAEYYRLLLNTRIEPDGSELYRAICDLQDDRRGKTRVFGKLYDSVKTAADSRPGYEYHSMGRGYCFRVTADAVNVYLNAWPWRD